MLHHDHLEDHVSDAAKTAWPGLSNYNRLTLLVLIVRRFEPTLICELCNGLDGNLKQRAVGSEMFSFSPVEMRGLSRRTKRTLEIGCDDLWLQLRTDHWRRLDTIERVLPFYAEAFQNEELEDLFLGTASKGAVDDPCVGDLESLEADVLADFGEFRRACRTMRYRAVVSRYRSAFKPYRHSAEPVEV